MKKILSLVLALMLTLSMTTIAFANESESSGSATIDTSTWKSAANENAATLKKLYTVSGSTETTLYPAETLTFAVSVPEGVTNPTEAMITVKDLTVTGNTDQEILISLPEYTKVGIYKYEIAENEVPTQGVVYTKDKIAVTVYVTYDYDNSCLKTDIVIGAVGSNNKIDTFTNEYNVGTLTVQKLIDGNLASGSAYFEMTVTLNSANAVASAITVSGGSDSKNPTTIAANDWTAKEAGGYTVAKTIYLRANETLTFSDIPDGVTYTVVEAAKHGVGDDGFDANSAEDTDYTISYENESGEIKKSETDAAVVKNTKNTSVDTGISLDNLPYIMMLMMAFAGVAFFAMKKRNAYED